MRKRYKEQRIFGKRLPELNLGPRSGAEAMSPASPVISDSDDELGPILSTGTPEKNTPSVANPGVSHSDDDDAPLSFKRTRAPAKNRPSVANPDVVYNDDDYDQPPTFFKKATTFVKNRSWATNPVTFNNDDNEYPLRSYKRVASTSLKNRPTLSKRKMRVRWARQLPQNHNDGQCSTEDSEGDEETQKAEDRAKSGGGNGGRLNKKHKGTTSVPSIEDSMLACIGGKREHASMEQKVSQQGQQYSVSRCLEVLHGMDDVSDEIKVLASDVLKDAESREFFLCYESRLRGPWLKKEVAKLATQLHPW